MDLICYTRQAGGLDQVLTVLQELAEHLDAKRLMRVAKADGQLASAQRLGWLLDKAGFAGRAAPLAQWVKARKPLPAKLEPSRPLRGSHRDPRWNLWINTQVEGDLA